MVQRLNLHYFRRTLGIAASFQVAWLITGLIFTLAGVQVGWGLLIANIFTLWIPLLFTFVTRIELPYRFQISLAIFLTASSLVGSALGGYRFIPLWDTIVHLYSGMVLAWFGFILADDVEGIIKKPLPLWFRNLVAIMVPLAFGTLWEIYEFVSDNTIGTNMQVGGLEDTIVDMSAAVVGAILAIIIVGMRSRFNK